MTFRNFPEIKVDEKTLYSNIVSNNIVSNSAFIKELDAITVSQRIIDFINSGGTFTDPALAGTVDLSSSVIPPELIGPDLNNLVDGINAATFDELDGETFDRLNRIVGSNSRELGLFISRFYLEFQIFRKGVLERLAEIPQSATLQFQLKPRIMVISTNIQPMMKYRIKLFWGTVDTSDWLDLTAAEIEDFENLGSVNVVDEDTANRLRVVTMLIPSAVRLVVKLGKYNGDGGDVPTNWNALAANATDDDLITAGWLTDLVEIEPILCTVDTTANVVLNLPQTEFDLPVYEEDSWIQTAFVVASQVIGVLAGAAGVPLPGVPADAWNGGSFEVANLALPLIELNAYVDTTTTLNDLYTNNASYAPMIGPASQLGTTYNDDSWIGYSYAEVRRGSNNVIEGSVPSEFQNPPPPQPINAIKQFGQETGYTSSIGLGDLGGGAYNYRWRSNYGVRFVDWEGSSFQADIDPISTGPTTSVLYSYSGTFDKTGIARSGGYVSDPAINYVSIGGRPYIYYQDTPTPAINERGAIIVTRV